MVVSIDLPASAGCTGLDPFRFFTGTVGTLKHKKNKLTLIYRHTKSRRAAGPVTSDKDSWRQNPMSHM